MEMSKPVEGQCQGRVFQPEGMDRLCTEVV